MNDLLNDKKKIQQDTQMHAPRENFYTSSTIDNSKLLTCNEINMKQYKQRQKHNRHMKTTVTGR